MHVKLDAQKSTLVQVIYRSIHSTISNGPNIYVQCTWVTHLEFIPYNHNLYSYNIDSSVHKSD